MSYLRVVNWEKQQHYANRTPPWIRLYNELLDDYGWGRLSDAGKAHLVGLYLLASRTGNRIPADPEWIGQRIQATSPVDVEELLALGFVERIDGAEKEADQPPPAKAKPQAVREVAGFASKGAKPVSNPASAEERRAEENRAEQRRKEEREKTPRAGAEGAQPQPVAMAAASCVAATVEVSGVTATATTTAETTTTATAKTLSHSPPSGWVGFPLSKPPAGGLIVAPPRPPACASPRPPSRSSPRSAVNPPPPLASPPALVEPTPAELLAYAREIGYSALNPEAFLAHYRTVGWRRGHTPIADWRPLVLRWKLQERGPPRKGVGPVEAGRKLMVETARQGNGGAVEVGRKLMIEAARKEGLHHEGG